MKTVSIREAKKRLTELAREVEEGATIVVTRNGRPVFDLVPHRKAGGINLAAGKVYLRSKGITKSVPFIADDFDAPLPEDPPPSHTAQGVKILIDTHVALALLRGSLAKDYPDIARRLTDPDTAGFVSVASFCEMAIKTRSENSIRACRWKTLPDIFRRLASRS